MKLHDLCESVEFHACSVEQKNGHTYIRPHGSRTVMADCPGCDGTGQEFGEECRWCNGKKQRETVEYDSPTLQAANANARAIVTELIGQEYDGDGGMIETKDLPDVRRRLIKALNSEKDRSRLHAPDIDHEQSFGRQGQEGNVVRIGRQGPKMYEFGRTDEQVLRYAHKLLEIVEYAMKNNLVVSWA